MRKVLFSWLSYAALAGSQRKPGGQSKVRIVA